MTKTTNFVWDSVSDSVISELDGVNTVSATYTNEPQHYGGVISQRRGATTSTLHADALGSTRLLTDTTQATIDTYLYDAWGNLITSSGTTVTPFRWVGRYGYYFDSITGLFYIRARTYQPTVARWLSVDPEIQFLDAAIPSRADVNGFLYLHAFPTMLVDPSGNYLAEFSPNGLNLGYIPMSPQSGGVRSADEDIRPETEGEGDRLRRDAICKKTKRCSGPFYISHANPPDPVGTAVFSCRVHPTWLGNSQDPFSCRNQVFGDDIQNRCEVTFRVAAPNYTAASAPQNCFVALTKIAAPICQPLCPSLLTRFHFGVFVAVTRWELDWRVKVKTCYFTCDVCFECSCNAPDVCAVSRHHLNCNPPRK